MNEAEQALHSALSKKGFEVLRRGWPDFLVIDRARVFAVELKSVKDRLSPEQRRMHEVLASVGVPVHTTTDPNRVDFKGRATLSGSDKTGLIGRLEQTRHEVESAVRLAQDRLAEFQEDVESLVVLFDDPAFLPRPPAASDHSLEIARIQANADRAFWQARSMARGARR